MKINIVRVTGTGNIVIQDATGKESELIVSDFIDRLTLEKDRLITHLENQILDKDRLLKYTDAELIALNEKLTKVQLEKEILISRVNDLVKTLANKDVSQFGDVYREALNKFLEGDIPGALDFLTDDKLETELKQIEEREQETKNRRRQLSETYMLRGQLLFIENDIESAKLNFDKALKVNRSFDSLLNVANFNLLVDNVDLALEQFSEAESIANSVQEINKALLGKGRTLFKKHEYEKARKCFSKGLSEFSLDNLEYDQLAVISELFESLSECERQYDLLAALESISKSIEIKERLYNVNPIQYLPGLAAGYKTLGLIYRTLNDFENTLPNLMKALHTYEQLTLIADMFIPHYASMFNEIGVTFRQMNVPQEAIRYYQYGIDYCGHEKFNRFEAEKLRASLLSNLGSLYLHSGDLTNAEQVLNEALTLRRSFSELNKNIYDVFVADTLINLGNLYARVGCLEEAEKSFEEALLIYKRYAIDSADEFLPQITQVEHNLGGLYQQIGNLLRAKDKLDSCVITRRGLSIQNPNHFKPLLFNSLCQLAQVEADLGDADLAEEYYDEATEALSEYANFSRQKDVVNHMLLSVNLAKFYLSYKVNREKSIGFLREFVLASRFIINVTYDLHRSKTLAEEIAAQWGIDWKSFAESVLVDSKKRH